MALSGAHSTARRFSKRVTLTLSYRAALRNARAAGWVMRVYALCVPPIQDFDVSKAVWLKPPRPHTLHRAAWGRLLPGSNAFLLVYPSPPRRVNRNASL